MCRLFLKTSKLHRFVDNFSPFFFSLIGISRPGALVLTPRSSGGAVGSKDFPSRPSISSPSGSGSSRPSTALITGAATFECLRIPIAVFVWSEEQRVQKGGGKGEWTVGGGEVVKEGREGVAVVIFPAVRILFVCQNGV